MNSTTPPPDTTLPAGSLVAVLVALLRRWRLLAGVSLLSGVAFLVVAFAQQGFVAQSSFRAETGGNQMNQVAALAAQFGVSVGSGETGAPLDFYRRLVQSREILARVALSRYRVRASGQREDTPGQTLVQIYGIRGGAEAQRAAKAYTTLLRNVSVSIDRTASIVEIHVTADSPDLAEQVNRRVLQLLNEFNVSKRSSGAVARRDFAARRTQEAEVELSAAETEMWAFLERNRQYQNSPQLVFAQQRLQRRVDLRQQVYTTLATAYEQARIDAERDLPVITIVEEPEGSAVRQGGLARRGALGTVVGFLIAMGAVFLAQHLAAERRRWPEPFAELERLADGWRHAVALRRRGASSAP